MATIRRLLVWAVACLLACGPLAGQQQLPGQRLRIIPLEGNNAINYIPILTITPPVVEVRDENERPVEGATVTFTAPPQTGPSATFGGSTSFTGTTDQRGQVGVTGYAINGKPGKFAIDITAVHEGRAGKLLMIQTNSIDKLPQEIGRKGGKLKWVLLSVAVAAGAGLGVYFGTRNTTGPISVGAGPVVIGGPR